MVNWTGQPRLRIGGTSVAQRRGDITDPVVAAFLGYMRKGGVHGAEVLVSFDGPYLIHTEIDSKSSAALNKVYRAEAATQREFWGPEPHQKVVIAFQHRNRALQPDDAPKREFLSRGQFQAVL